MPQGNARFGGTFAINLDILNAAKRLGRTLMRRLIVGLTGATGAIFGIRLLEALKGCEIESHLILSRWAERTIKHETRYTIDQVMALASVHYNLSDMGAAVSSGSFLTEGMVVIPCSMRTLAGIAHGYGEHLIHRAADVVLKERRRLVLVPRETPLSEVHIENMLKLARIGVAMLPPMPAFYNHPRSIEDIVDHVVARVLDQFGIAAPFAKRWDGRMENLARTEALRAVAAVPAGKD
jgi:4-hydroxy-3-polyprenylbenzoate decarboxylase